MEIRAASCIVCGGGNSHASSEPTIMRRHGLCWSAYEPARCTKTARVLCRIELAEATVFCEMIAEKFNVTL